MTRRPSTRAFLAVLLITAAAWIVGSAIGNVTAQNSSGLASVYLPIGLAVAILLRVRAGALWLAVLAGILVGAAGTTVVTGAALGPVLLASSANAVQAVVIAWLLLRLSAERFDRPRDVASLAIAGVIGCAVGAILGAAATWLTSGADPMSTASTWFWADLVAVVLVVPAATVIRLPRRLHPWMLGYVGLLALMILAAVAATTDTPTANTPFLVFLARYVLGVLLLTVGFLYGTVGLGLIQIPAVTAGFAALADGALVDRQAIIIVLVLTLLAAALAVRRELAQRAAAEALTEGLFTYSPVATARITQAPPASGPAMGASPSRLVVDQANAAWCVLLGLDPAHANDTDLVRSVHPDDADDVRDLIARADPAEPTHRDVRLIRRGGDRTLLVRLTSVAMANSDDGRGELGAILVAEDITERREAEERLNRQARTDGLTGLLNRSSVTEVLEAGLAATSDGAEPLSTLFVDLDGFKAVNDNHGHATGDLVLKEVAARLLDAVRPRDAVGRYGGDEFLIVATGLGSESAAQALVERIHQALAPPMPVLGHDIVIGASIGIAVAQHGDTADTMLPRADADMYAGKSRSRT